MSTSTEFSREEKQVQDTLNDLRIVRMSELNGGIAPMTLSMIWWESLGGMTFRLKDYKTLDVLGSVRRIIGFHGFRWEATKHGVTREFAALNEASAWVEVNNNATH